MKRGGIIGFGNMGQQFVRFVRERPELDVEIVAACDRGARNLSVARDEFGLLATHDVDELLAQHLDFVLVASQSNAHADYVVAAAKVGCHIFCEKPIALTLADADRMIAATDAADVITSVNYVMRYNSGFIAIREMIRSGELGDILSISHAKTRGFGLYVAGARHRAVIEPEESGGWVVHHACHDLDFLYWVGGPIRRVTGVAASTFPDGPSEEVVLGIVQFESGAIGSVGDSVCGIRDHYTRIIGSKASLVMTGENDHTVCRLRREGAGEDELLPLEDRKHPGNGLEHFFECVRSGTKSPNSLKDARPSLAAAIALRESARTGAPVQPS